MGSAAGGARGVTFRLAAIAVAALAAFSALAVVVTVEKAPLPGDRWLLGELQEPGWLVEPAKAVNLAGDHEFVTLIVAFGIAVAAVGRDRVRAGSTRPVVAAFLVAVVFLSLDQEIKKLVESPRPTAAEGFTIHDTSGTFGYPSGHAFSVTVAAGLMAAFAARGSGWQAGGAWWAVAVAAGATQGLARVILGAHWPSDVVGGWLLAAGAVALCVLAGSLAGGPTRGQAGARRKPTRDR